MNGKLTAMLAAVLAMLMLASCGGLYNYPDSGGESATPTDGAVRAVADSHGMTAREVARKYFADPRTRAYLRFIAERGIRVVGGDRVVIDSPVENAEPAYMLAEFCYKRGAAAVHIIYSDDASQALALNYLDEGELAAYEYPNAWSRIAAQGIKDFCYIRLDSATVFESDEGRLFAYNSGYSAKVIEAKKLFGVADRRKWTIFACPTLNWAKCVYPELDEAQALTNLWEDVFAFSHVEPGDDDCSALREHMNSLQYRTATLNSMDIASLRYKSSAVDLEVKLHDRAIFASSAVGYGIINVPSEESFTTPDKFSASGTVRCTRPLVYNGCVIEGIALTLKDGRIVEWSSETNEALLTSLIETDDGSHYLGEISLVSDDGAIAQRDTLYYLTLVDENASCHIAFGNSYPDETLFPATKSDERANYSKTHIDIMIGSPDLNVTATLKNGSEALLIKDGKWMI